MTTSSPQVSAPDPSTPPSADVPELITLQAAAGWLEAPPEALRLMIDASMITALVPSDGGPTMLRREHVEEHRTPAASPGLRAARALWAYLSSARPASTRARAKAGHLPLWIKARTGPTNRRPFVVSIRPEWVTEWLVDAGRSAEVASFDATRALTADWGKRRLVTPYGETKQVAFATVAAPSWVTEAVVGRLGDPSGEGATPDPWEQQA